MQQQEKPIESTGFAPPDSAVEDGEQLLRSIGEEELRYRAYEIYLQRGATSGYELDDWLQVDRELTHNRPTETTEQR
jgi:DUF2934 family protein